MNWDDTIGQNIHAQMYNKALEVRPTTNKEALQASIKRSTVTVGIVRNSIADVLDAEIETMVALRSLGDRSISLDFLAGLLAAADLVRKGTHVTDNL